MGVGLALPIIAGVVSLIGAGVDAVRAKKIKPKRDTSPITQQENLLKNLSQSTDPAVARADQTLKQSLADNLFSLRKLRNPSQILGISNNLLNTATDRSLDIASRDIATRRSYVSQLGGLRSQLQSFNDNQFLTDQQRKRALEGSAYRQLFSGTQQTLSNIYSQRLYEDQQKQINDYNSRLLEALNK